MYKYTCTIKILPYFWLGGRGVAHVQSVIYVGGGLRTKHYYINDQI